MTKNWLRRAILVCVSVFPPLRFIIRLFLFAATAGLVSHAYVTAAQELERSPNSIDPILRIAPLEKERVHPNSIPALSFAPVPGKQTLVLHPYPEQSRVPQTPLIILHIPQNFFSRTSSTAADVFGVNLFIKYPSMTPSVENMDSCRGWCDGKMLISLQNRRIDWLSSASQRMKAVREDIARQAAMSDPLITYTPIKPPPDYDEAFDLVYLKLKDGDRQKQYLFKNQSTDSNAEFVTCYPLVPSPACEFIISVPAQRRLEIHYTHSMSLWTERRSVQASITRVVEDFYQGEIVR